MSSLEEPLGLDNYSACNGAGWLRRFSSSACRPRSDHTEMENCLIESRECSSSNSCNGEYVRQTKSNDRFTRNSLMSRTSSLGRRKVLDGVCDAWCLQDHCCSLPRNGIEIRDLVDKIFRGMPSYVKIVEVGPRDGLQNEKSIIPTKVKIDLIRRLTTTGLSVIEATSFVSPKWVPQLADAKDVIEEIRNIEGIEFPVLTPNLKGFKAAIAAGVKEVAVFASASEAFSLSNINCSIKDSLARYQDVIHAAKALGVPVRGFIRMGGGARRKDPAWKYGTQVEVPGEGAKKGYVYLKCKFCDKRITGVKKLKDHLACTYVNVGVCDKVPEEVKKECLEYLKKYATSKETVQRNMEEMIGNSSYYGSQQDGSSSGSHLLSSERGTRGPMDRFVVNVDEEENRNSQTIPPASVKEHRNRVCLDIARCFYENGISFNVARSASWINMLRSVGNFGRGLEIPSMYELRTWMLDEEVKTTTRMVDEVKKTWAETGVTIMSDGWSDIRQRSIINFLVNNPYGTVFLKSVDASAFVKDSQLLFQMLDEVVEEVGESLVVQVVTDNASAYKAAGRMLMEKRSHLYWTPCAAHCLDLMLEKLG